MPHKEKKYTVIGLMSGTSLDGLDVACCEFWYDGTDWSFSILLADTFSYPSELKSRLKECMNMDQDSIQKLDIDLGIFFGEQVKKFVQKTGTRPELIASHGHTVFHQPEKGITLQIGSGREIKNITGIPVINDFRSEDVRLGGQGAPLVPIGDRLLFSEYECCVNLGGIANVSFDDAKGERRAYDICGCNLILNELSSELGYSFDMDGNLAKSGMVNSELLDKLLMNPYLEKAHPKSLGKEDVWRYDLNVINEFQGTIQDKLATYVAYIALNIGKVISGKRTLLTGGGALNEYLVSKIKDECGQKSKVHVPERLIVEFKEALIFAFLGVLREREEVNVLSSVTGASRDSSSGVRI